MKMESLVRLLAGMLILLGLLLAYFVSPWWLALIGFVGVNLFQSAFTNFCVAEMIFRRLGWGADGRHSPPSATKR